MGTLSNSASRAVSSAEFAGLHSVPEVVRPGHGTLSSGTDKIGPELFGVSNPRFFERGGTAVVFFDAGSWPTSGGTPPPPARQGLVILAEGQPGIWLPGLWLGRGDGPYKSRALVRADGACVWAWDEGGSGEQTISVVDAATGDSAVIHTMPSDLAGAHATWLD